MAKELDLTNINFSEVTFGGGLILGGEQDFSAPPSEAPLAKVVQAVHEVAEIIHEMAEDVHEVQYQEDCTYHSAEVAALGIGNAGYLNSLTARIKNRPAKISTGIKELDEVTGGGYPCGISVLAALPNIGKTTLLLQSAAAMTMQGTAVIYVSHDMRELDLTAKVIVNISHKFYGEECYTIRDILGTNILADETDKSMRVLKEVERTQKNLFIRDLIYDPVFDDFCKSKPELDGLSRMQQIFHVYCSTYRKVIFICDSLQQIAAYHKGSSGKDSIDKQLQEFKWLSTTYEIPLILISTLNRSSYSKNSGMDFSGLKESGSIEYDADTVLMAFPKFDGEKKEDFSMDEFREKDYRDITIKCIKSRDSGYKERTMTLYAPGCTFIEYEASEEEESPSKVDKRKKNPPPERIPPNRNYM